MKSFEILKEEARKAGMHELENIAEDAIKLVFEKVLPRLAIEADEAPVKMIAGVAMLAAGPLEKAALDAADKIDPNS